MSVWVGAEVQALSRLIRPNTMTLVGSLRQSVENRRRKPDAHLLDPLGWYIGG